MDCNGSSTVGCQWPCETSDRGRARTSCPLPASSCPGTSSPPSSSTLPSPSSHWCRPARKQSAVSIVRLIISQCSSAGHGCIACARVVLGERGGADGGDGLLVEPPRSVARSCLGAIPHRDQHASCISRTPPTMHLSSPMDCTYRPFLSLRRATVMLTHSGARGFPLRGALHFH